MIMFRQKIDPQTVISVENSLPKIVLALILVSISFAISGLMIDISNIATLLFANILAAYHAGALSSWLENIMGTSKNNQKTIFELLYDIGGKASKNLATGPIADTVVKISIDISRVIVGPLAELILNVAILGALFKTFFALLAAYVQIVFLTIMSPLIFLSSAVPGKGGAVSKWIKDMLANTMAFPVTFIFLFLGAIIAETPITGKPDSWQIKPPGVAFTTPWIPFGLAGFGTGGASTLIKELLAFGIVLAAPTIPGIVKEFFESKESALSAGTAQGLQSTLQRIPIIGSFLG
ncbi:hypothetical protein HY030_03665, partial [Candidatus Gottesmanbacteria bacterium]|nr:hypothetical protein [Candidatus Gottesmanbacteria bacterium]